MTELQKNSWLCVVGGFLGGFALSAFVWGVTMIANEGVTRRELWRKTEELEKCQGRLSWTSEELAKLNVKYTKAMEDLNWHLDRPAAPAKEQDRDQAKH